MNSNDYNSRKDETYLSLLQSSNAKTSVNSLESEIYSAINVYRKMRSAWENYQKDTSSTNEPSIVIFNDAVIYVHS